MQYGNDAAFDDPFEDKADGFRLAETAMSVLRKTSISGNWSVMLNRQNQRCSVPDLEVCVPRTFQLRLDDQNDLSCYRPGGQFPEYNSRLGARGVAKLSAFV